MSHFETQPVECKHCHKEGEMQVWDLVDVDSNPELREKILNGELFTFHCPHCGKETIVPHAVLYHDMEHKFAVLLTFKPDGFDYGPLDIPAPPDNMVEEYKFRVVFNWSDLKEKILILEQELNDIAIERFKYMQLHYFASKNGWGDNTIIRFEKADTTNADWAKAQMTFIVYDSNKEKPGRIAMLMDKYYQFCLACELDPRMTVKGYCCIDGGWISKRFKEEK